MGERQVFQPLTREDRVTVVLYRSGIACSCIIVAALAVLLRTAFSWAEQVRSGTVMDVLLYGLYATVGMSVLFIHLYVAAFKRFLLVLYGISLGGLAVLAYLGGGSLVRALTLHPVSALLVLPLSGCLGFVTAKEAFCFRLLEGYLLALIMPVYLVLAAGGFLGPAGAATGLAAIAVLFILFTLRKVFMPIAYDIGDKSAYR